MSDEQIVEGNLQAEELTPAYESEQDVNDEAEAGLELEQSQTEPVEDDSDDVELDGKTFRVPKDIKSAVLRHKDYTEKTMALAEQRKSFEAETQFHKQFNDEIVQGKALANQLAEYNKVDWNSLSDQDPVMWQKLFSQKSQLEQQLNQIAQTIQQKRQQIDLNEQQTNAKLLEESESVLRRDIKDWSPEYESKLMQFGYDNYGVSKEDFKRSKANPMTMKLLHDAYVGKQIIQKQIAKPKIVQKTEPVSIVSGRAAKVAKAPSEMTTKEYAEWRRQGYK